MLIIGLFIVAIAGALSGFFAELITLYLLGFIIFQFRQLRQLYRWALSSDVENVPFDDGLMGQLAYYIHQNKKQRLEQKGSVKYQLDRFKKLISVFPDGVVILSLGNEIQWFNNQASTLLVLEKRDIGQPINHLVRHPRFTNFLKHLSEDDAIVLDAPVAETNFSAEKMEIRILPYGDDERLLLVRDVTKVERANQIRKDFVSNASHELRTPLTVMKGYVEMLMSSSSEETQYTAPLKKVEQQVIKMQTMIEELLELSRLEEGKVEASYGLVNVHSLCKQIESEFGLVAQEKGQALTFDISPTINLKGNKESLLTILRNLVANAVNYSSVDGDIYVGWIVENKGEGVLFVKDSGDGIAARHLARLTERFYRVAENSVKNKTGTGLGLAIVKHELERHEARLIIESMLGEGSCFKCFFPANRFES
jgi:two-component system phosphate regulon sensor histidine kinase PhoR